MRRNDKTINKISVAGQIFSHSYCVIHIENDKKRKKSKDWVRITHFI